MTRTAVDEALSMGSSTDLDSLEWTTREDGVHLATIHQGEGFVFSAIRIPPHTDLGKHWHPETESVYVLNGMLFVDHSPHGAGSIIINQKGSCHSTATREEGCTLLVVWCGYVEHEPPSA